jgi:hypothetical protein
MASTEAIFEENEDFEASINILCLWIGIEGRIVINGPNIIF